MEALNIFLGEFELLTFELANGFIVCYPSPDYIVKFIFLLVFTYYFLKGLFSLMRAFI